MDFHVSLTGRGDLTARIYRQILDAILDGRLRSGERLPPTRELALRLDVSRNTVAVAYERLTAEGFLVGRVGAGTFVCAEPLDQVRPREAPVGGDVEPRAVWRSITAVYSGGAAHPAEYDFAVGVFDLGLFPFEAWRRLVARELRAGAVRSADYGDPATQGAQQALDVIGRVLIEPGACVAVEEPGYPPARNLFRSLGARVVGVPVDDEGLDVGALPAEAALVYTTPSHQYPLGTPMSLGRRAALLAWAERHGALVIEDDYDSEFRFSDRPLEPLQSLDRGGRVIYVGTFSKTMLPILRLGFLVAPASLQPALRSAKQLTDWHGETPTQAALAHFIGEGLLAQHVRRASREYAVRHELVSACLRADFAEWLDLVPSAAGLHLCARLASGADIDVDRVVARAGEAGVAVRSLADLCGAEPTQPGVVLGYGSIGADRIAEGLRRLADCFRGG